MITENELSPLLCHHTASKHHGIGCHNLCVRAILEHDLSGIAFINDVIACKDVLEP